MTPLAQKYFGQLLMKRADRAEDPYGKLRMPQDLHCFECSAIAPSINECLLGIPLQSVLDVPGPHFLPAPSTWIDFIQDGKRYALWISEDHDGSWILDWVNYDEIVIPVAVLTPPNALKPEWDIRVSPDGVTPQFGKNKKIFIIGFTLTIIDVLNTPNLVTKQPHAPHSGFQKRMLGKGSWPLLAWHEVTVNPESVRKVKGDDGSTHFRKALHFVRKHIRRLPNGGTTLVTSHWRGDPQIGIMQTRYRIPALRRLDKAIRKSVH